VLDSDSCLSLSSDTVMNLQISMIFAMLFFAMSFAKVFDVNEEGPDSSSSHVEGDVVELYDTVLRLNRYSFDKTVLQDSSEVAHWIILFCPAWFEPCQALEPLYRRLSETWQGRLNNALLSTEVRFASVDCAKEKELCNTQDVGMNYPYVGHYKDHKKVARWKGKSFQSDEKRLKQWLQEQLGNIDSALRIGLETEAEAAESNFNIPVDFLLICAAIVGNAVFISRGGFGAEASCTSKSKSTLSNEGSAADSAPSTSCRARSQTAPASLQL